MMQMECADEVTLTRFELFVRILLDTHEELHHYFVVVFELLGVQDVRDQELLIDKVYREPGFDFCHLGNGDVFDPKEPISDARR